jgi:hypothetical protein
LAFRKKLQAFAATKAIVGEAKYWAIIRRGLDAADAMKAGNGNLDSIVLDDLNSVPSRADLEPMGQNNTRMRLGPELARMRIVGGFPVVDDSVQEVVAIEGHNHICSGIAIDRQHVLTAAHCVADLQLAQGGETKVVLVGNDTHAANKLVFNVVAGQTKVFGGFACLGQVTTPPCHDLALITIDGAMPRPSVVFGTPSMLAGALPRRNPHDPPFQIFGFGCSVPPTSFDASGHPACPTSKIGEKRTALLYKSGGCNAGVPSGCQTDEFELDDDVSDACIGDSGGPVILSPKQDDGIGYRLVGITSRSIISGCGPRIGGIYTSTTTHDVITWLQGNGVTVTQR